MDRATARVEARGWTWVAVAAKVIGAAGVLVGVAQIVTWFVVDGPHRGSLGVYVDIQAIGVAMLLIVASAILFGLGELLGHVKAAAWFAANASEDQPVRTGIGLTAGQPPPPVPPGVRVVLGVVLAVGFLGGMVVLLAHR
jgi:hypothetical protein